jgi:hypothetical protein
MVVVYIFHGRPCTTRFSYQPTTCSTRRCPSLFWAFLTRTSMPRPHYAMDNSTHLGGKTSFLIGDCLCWTPSWEALLLWCWRVYQRVHRIIIVVLLVLVLFAVMLTHTNDVFPPLKTNIAHIFFLHYTLLMYVLLAYGRHVVHHKIGNL